MEETIVEKVGTVRCSICFAKLPLRIGRVDEPSFEWECVHCKTQCKGVLLQHVSPSVRDAVRMTGFQIDERMLAPLDEAILGVPGIDERRDSTRRHFGIKVCVIPLDSGSHPCGDAFLVMARDISTSGLGLMYPAPIESPLLALQIPIGSGGTVQVIGRVTRCTRSGNGFNIGVRLLKRMGLDET